MFTPDELLDRIAEEYGDIDEIIEHADETEIPGACHLCSKLVLMADTLDTWCDDCGEDSVKSVLVLAGVP